MEGLLVGLAGVITAIATLVGGAKGIEALMKIRESRAKGKADNEISVNASLTASWQAAQAVQNQNIADIWRELNWLREEREFDVIYIDELHNHIDELRDIALTNRLAVPPTPRRRLRRAPPALGRNPAEVLAELNQTLAP